MNRPGYRASTARPRAAQEREVVTVDYADVLRQAVENERWRVLREVRRAEEAVGMTEPDGRNSWSTRERSGRNVKSDIESALDRIERGS